MNLEKIYEKSYEILSDEINELVQEIKGNSFNDLDLEDEYLNFLLKEKKISQYKYHYINYLFEEIGNKVTEEEYKNYLKKYIYPNLLFEFMFYSDYGKQKFQRIVEEEISSYYEDEED